MPCFAHLALIAPTWLRIKVLQAHHTYPSADDSRLPSVTFHSSECINFKPRVAGIVACPSLQETKSAIINPRRGLHTCAAISEIAGCKNVLHSEWGYSVRTIGEWYSITREEGRQKTRPKARSCSCRSPPLGGSTREGVIRWDSVVLAHPASCAVRLLHFSHFLSSRSHLTIQP